MSLDGCDLTAAITKHAQSLVSAIMASKHGLVLILAVALAHINLTWLKGSQRIQIHSAKRRAVRACLGVSVGELQRGKHDAGDDANLQAKDDDDEEGGQQECILYLRHLVVAAH